MAELLDELIRRDAVQSRDQHADMPVHEGFCAGAEHALDRGVEHFDFAVLVDGDNTICNRIHDQSQIFFALLRR